MIDLLTALKRVQQVVSLRPQVAVVLGSGLGELVEQFSGCKAIPYKDIPEFPHSRVVGHAGNLVFGTLHGIPLVAMQGRAHYYEGHDMQKVVFGVRLMKLLGAHTIITTNAVGAINKKYKVGDLMLIRDHLNFLGDHPLRGPNIDALGPRFYDMTVAYDPKLRATVKRVAKKLKIPMQEGVYAACMGPSYETPAEIRMLRLLGADAVGMSTVPEILAARHMGMRCLSISLISNMGAGVTKNTLSHAEVVEAGKKVSKSFQNLLSAIFKESALKAVQT